MGRGQQPEEDDARGVRYRSEQARPRTAEPGARARRGGRPGRPGGHGLADHAQAPRPAAGAGAPDVGPMSLYYHVAGKDEILDGMVDLVFGEVELPLADAEWKTAMRDRAASARDALRRHPPAPPARWATGT